MAKPSTSGGGVSPRTGFAPEFSPGGRSRAVAPRWSGGGHLITLVLVAQLLQDEFPPKNVDELCTSFKVSVCRLGFPQEGAGPCPLVGGPCGGHRLVLSRRHHLGGQRRCTALVTRGASASEGRPFLSERTEGGLLGCVQASVRPGGPSTRVPAVRASCPSPTVRPARGFLLNPSELSQSPALLHLCLCLKFYGPAACQTLATGEISLKETGPESWKTAESVRPFPSGVCACAG